MYKVRRKKLLQAVKKEHAVDQGAIVLFADFENERHPFRQESSFYYLTGITEPGAVFVIDLSGDETLYLPKYSKKREQWVANGLDEELSNSDLRPIDVKELGDEVPGYTLGAHFSVESHKHLVEDLEGSNASEEGKKLFSLLDPSRYFFSFYRFTKLFGDDVSKAIDISKIVARMRRKKR